MIAILIAAVAVAVLYRLGSTPEAVAIEEKVEAARDEHRRQLLNAGIIR
jgi:hypothetical protein